MIVRIVIAKVYQTGISRMSSFQGYLSATDWKVKHDHSPYCYIW